MGNGERVYVSRVCPTPSDCSPIPPPVVHAGATAIAAGYTHSMMLKQDDTVWGTGASKNGQLGDGTTREKTYAFVKAVLSGQCGTKG